MEGVRAAFADTRAASDDSSLPGNIHTITNDLQRRLLFILHRALVEARLLALARDTQQVFDLTVLSDEAPPLADYRTAAGARPVKDFIDRLTDEEAASLVAAMKEIVERGLPSARHLRGDIYEVRADAEKRSFRVLFSKETKFILLSLSVFEKRTQKTPARELELAERRLKDWRARDRS